MEPEYKNCKAAPDQVSCYKSFGEHFLRISPSSLSNLLLLEVQARGEWELERSR